MKYLGKTSYWEKYINKFYKINTLYYIMAIIIGLIFCAIDIMFFSGRYVGLVFLTILILILFLPINLILGKLKIYNYTKYDTCLSISDNLFIYTGSSKDKGVKVISLLELKEDCFVLNGIFEGENYSFINKDFTYREVLSLSTNFNDYFTITCVIANEFGWKESITLDIYNIYDIDLEGMQYFYDKYSQYKDCELD